MENMGRDEELFFHFLRLGLWGEEPDEPGYDMTGLTRDDWCRIYDMGHRQAVSGIVTDGIAHCGVRPDGELCTFFHSVTCFLSHYCQFYPFLQFFHK